MAKSIVVWLILFLVLSVNCFSQKAGEKIQIDGKNISFQLYGMENRQFGQPLVILESDHAPSFDTWTKVIDNLGKNVPVLAYDRAGIGQSDAFDESPTPENRTQQLKKLLEKLNLEPPYILVGHGWGSILIKDFAMTYPESVEGMIYIDPVDESSSFEKMVSIFDQQGWEGEKVANEFFEVRKERFQQAPEGIRAEAQVMYEFAKGEKSNPKLYDFPEIPSAILLGGKHIGTMGNPLEPTLSVDYQQLINLLQRNRISNLTDLILGRQDSEMILLSNYMHYLQLQEPEKISASILSKYHGDPAKKLVTAAQKYDSDQFKKYLEGLETHSLNGQINEAKLNMLGYDQLRKDQPEHAMVLFEYNLEQNPSSANVYDSMGDGLVAMGKTKDAVPYYEKAVQLGEQSKHRDLGLFKKNLASVKAEK